MRKRLIILSVSLSVAAGSVAAYAVTKFAQEPIAPTVVTYDTQQTTPRFTAAATDGTTQLPDLTTAAEQGVEAVVNIEKRQTVTYNTPQGIDPFELFFGTPRQQQQQSQPQSQQRRSGGSGVIISEDGYIISNNHVVENADELIVTLHDGTTHKATIVGTDPSTDVALIKIDAKGLKTLAFGDSDDLRLGQWVLAIGNPYGLTSTVTAGIISAKGRSLNALPAQIGIESFIQTDAAVNPGNSGGALITTDGKLIGINTIIASPTGSYTGYSFAIPTTIVRKVVADLREYGIVQRAMLGIQYQEITGAWIEQFGKEKKITEPGGVYIAEVVEGGAAEAAGIKSGDILVGLGGRPVRTSADIQETIAKLRPNDKIDISAKRDGTVKQFSVTLRNKAGKTELVSKDDVDLLKELGATFREITDKQKKELRIRNGLQVTDLQPNGLLARSRVQRGFIITSINDIPVGSVNDLNRITDPIQSIDGIYPDGRIVSYQAMAK